MIFLGSVRMISTQIIKFQVARTPSIKFRKGGTTPSAHSSPGAATSTPQSAKPGQTSVITQNELPARFRRKPLSEEEIDYINRGGPA